MSGNFSRAPPPDSINPMDQASYAQIEIPDYPSWHLVKEADFIVYDRERGLEMFSEKPTSEYTYNIEPFFHDATVYDSNTNEILRAFRW
jgi:hypothetical protein